MFCSKGFGMIMVLVWAMALSSDLSLVSGQTVAPLVTSTVKPTSAPKAEAMPTKPMIVNAPPMKPKKPEPLVKAKDSSKPLQVTGFITKSGNIYEIEDKRGMGAIEGRQAVEEKQDEQIVCNYGNVVIYSDVPCDQVTNVRVGEIKQIKDGQVESNDSSTTDKAPADGDKDQQAMQEQNEEQNDEEQEEDQQEAQQSANHPRQQQNNRRRRRPQQQRQKMQQQRRRQQQQQRRRRNGNGNRNGNVVVRRRRNRNGNQNNNRNGLRRGQQQQRRGRPNNNNRRRNGNANNNANNNNRRRNNLRQQPNRRRTNNNRQRRVPLV
ncbi:hypothetical protein KR018_009195 [Drosophila ironensis]|nr:hypothetical protein KR018_009195 [Drosophila ironensis]